MSNPEISARRSAPRGIFAPVPTPFEPGGLRLDAARLSENLARWMEHPLAGVLVLGSNGELPYLEEAECDEVVATARRAVPSDRLLLVGAGREGTRATLAAVRRAFDLGADAVLVVTPSYYRGRMTAPALTRHYETVAAAAEGSVLLYHVPAYTALEMPLPMVLELARHPAIRGIKDSSGDVSRIERLAALAPADFSLLCGSASVLYPSLEVGAGGGIVAPACVAPAECCALWAAHQEGDAARARALQARLAPLASAITRRHGIPGLKALLDRIGYYGGPPRGPLLSLEESDRDDLWRTWEAFQAASVPRPE